MPALLIETLITERVCYIQRFYYVSYSRLSKKLSVLVYRSSIVCQLIGHHYHHSKHHLQQDIQIVQEVHYIHVVDGTDLVEDVVHAEDTTNYEEPTTW